MKGIIVGDYIEVLETNGGDIKVGEQGVVTSIAFKWKRLTIVSILFPAHAPPWCDDSFYNWFAPTGKLKRVCRLGVN